MAKDIQLRRITGADAQAYYELRLEGLRLDAHAFGGSYEEFENESLTELGQRFDRQYEENRSFVIGAYEYDALRGVMGLRRNTGIKLKHKAFLWGTYVTAMARGKGIASRLLEQVIEEAKVLPGLESVLLGVGTENASALSLYEKAGFTVYGTERRALKVDDKYIDEYLMELNL